MGQVWLAQDGDYKGNAEEGEQYEKETPRKRNKQGKGERSMTILEAFSTGSFEEKSALSRTPDSELRSPENLKISKGFEIQLPTNLSFVKQTSASILTQTMKSNLLPS
jgi:hypothetical protein